MQIGSTGRTRNALCTLGFAVAVGTFGIVVAGCAVRVDGASSTHNVNVTIQQVNTPPPGIGWTCKAMALYEMCVSEEPIILTPDERPVQIYWNIQSGGAFDKDHGIVVTPSGGGWITSRLRDTLYSATTKTRDGNIYKYSMSVVATDGTALSWDPTIMNY